jgi:hypothetical protein
MEVLMKTLMILLALTLGCASIATADPAEKARIYNFLDTAFGPKISLEVKACIYGCMKGKTTSGGAHQTNVDVATIMHCMQSCDEGGDGVVGKAEKVFKGCDKAKGQALFQCVESKNARVPANK